MNLCLSYFLRGQNRSKIFCFIKRRELLLLYLNPDGRRGGLYPSPLCLQFQNPFCISLSLPFGFPKRSSGISQLPTDASWYRHSQSKWFVLLPIIIGAPLVAQTVKNLPAMQETWVWSLSQKDPLEKVMAAQAVFLPGEFHGPRSLGGYGPGCSEGRGMRRWSRGRVSVRAEVLWQNKPAWPPSRNPGMILPLF